MTEKLRRKLTESLLSVLPITIIVFILNFTVAPIPTGNLWLFALAAVLLVFGMGLFTLGADLSMMPMGEAMGARLTKSKRPILILAVCFILGVIITIAEPDLQVLAEQVVGVENSVIILTVALGVGIFLALSLVRIAFNIPLSIMFLILYSIVFILGFFVPQDFIAIAFDSGGVTTGPITVPFIMALGIGLSSVLSSKDAHDNSFGLIAFCSIGPILAVMIMGCLVNVEGSYSSAVLEVPSSLTGVLTVFTQAAPLYFKEVAIALAPILLFFLIFQIFFLKLPKEELLKIAAGLVYTYLGLGLFLTSVNIGFMPIGTYLGETIASLSYAWILIPLGFVMGCSIIAAEPAVHVLNKEVEEITGGSISKTYMMAAFAISVGISLSLAMLRILTGLSLWYFIIPGYAIALFLTFFTPKIFTGIAFDSGGVASGPMTATFLLPLAMGVCMGVGGNIFTDAFGLVAMVAMTPLITIQIMGIYFKAKASATFVENTIPPQIITESEGEIELDFDLELDDEDSEDEDDSNGSESPTDIATTGADATDADATDAAADNSGNATPEDKSTASPTDALNRELESNSPTGQETAKPVANETADYPHDYDCPSLDESATWESESSKSDGSADNKRGEENKQ